MINLNFEFMQQKTFPKFEAHNSVSCFHCDATIGQTEKPLFYGFPNGAYGMWCKACNWRTYYDTADKSIKFDKKGDPLTPTCSCGCVTPYAQWLENESGYKECPECRGV
jgi:hypothetical protein